MSRRDANGPPLGLVGAGALLLTLGGVLLWLVMLAGPARLGTGLLEARDHLSKAQKALKKGAFRQAVYETHAAQGATDRARRGFEASSPLVDLATLSATVDDALEEVPHLISAADHSADAAAGTLDIGLGALRGPEAVIDADPEDPKSKIIRLDRIEELGATLDGVRSDVRSAGDELKSVDPANLPARLRHEIADGIEDAQETDELLAKAEAGFELLPSILGAQGPRIYMLGFQNSAELRGSGGALLQFEFLTIDDGRPQLASNNSENAVGSIYQIDEDRRTYDIPLPEDAWYLASIEDAQRFGNFNWSPDWPMDAQIGIDYGRVAAQSCVTTKNRKCPPFPRIDGVVAIDPVAVKKLVPGIGPFSQGRYYITRSTVLDVLLSRAYSSYPIPFVRRDFLSTVVQKLFDGLFNPARPSELILGFGDALAQKHVQIWMKAPTEQAFVNRMNWDGGIASADRTDYLNVVQQNVGGNKLDYAATQTTEIDIDIEGNDALTSTRVTVRNGVVLPQPRWVLGDSKSAHRPMLNIYVPGDAELLGAETGETCPAPFDRRCNGRIDTPGVAAWTGETPPTHFEKNKKVWTATLQIPAGEEGSFAVDYRVPGAVRAVRGRRTYRLVIQRQPKVTPEDLLVRLRVPAGARDLRAPGFEQQGETLVYERPLTKDTVLEVSWRD
ncbi:MAG: DUF4012 domain-containing protein [Actinomycetota bacterium]